MSHDAFIKREGHLWAVDENPGGTLWERQSPFIATWVARAVQLTGLVNVVSGVLPGSRPRLGLLLEVVPLVGIQTARAATIVIGLLLMFLGSGLRRRKRQAWQVAAPLAAASVAFNVVKGLDLDAAIISGGLLAMLLATRRQFRAEADQRSRWRALIALVGFGATGFVLGLAVIAVRADRLVGNPPPRLWLKHVALNLVGLDGPLRFTSQGTAGAVSLITGALGLLAAGIALVFLLRPGTGVVGQSVDEEPRLRELLVQHGARDSLGYFALRADKSLIWSPTGKAVVAYRVIHGVSLASGDPIGDPEAWPGAIRAWLAECRRHAWTPAVLGCSERAGRAYERFGLDALELGDEAIVDVAQFTLEGRQIRSVRQAVARVERAGYRCELAYHRDLPASAVAAAVRAAEQLRDGHVERGFSMALGRVGYPADESCLLVLAKDAMGRVRGMLQFVPWGSDGLSLDVMRRDRTSDNGLVEYMIVTVLRRARELGVRRLSLNFAVLRSVFARGDRLGAGPVLRLWRRILVVASRFWQIESLYRANAKYQPTWRPRYICFPTVRDLPRIGVAALRAEAFLVAPRPVSRPVSRLLTAWNRRRSTAGEGPAQPVAMAVDPGGEAAREAVHA